MRHRHSQLYSIECIQYGLTGVTSSGRKSPLLPPRRVKKVAHFRQFASVPSVGGTPRDENKARTRRRGPSAPAGCAGARAMSSFSADDSEAWIRSTPPRVSSGARVSSDARLTVLPHSPRGRGGGGAVSRCLPSLAIGKRCTSFSLSNQQLENQLALAAMTYMAQRGGNCGH